MNSRSALRAREAALVFQHLADLVVVRGQADAATETFGHLDRFFFDSRRDMFMVTSRLRKHADKGWPAGFFDALDRLRATAVATGAPRLAAVVQAADDLVAHHDLVRQASDYAHPDHVEGVFYPAVLAAENAARALSAEVGALAADAVAAAGARRRPGPSTRATAVGPGHARSSWGDVDRVPARIWRRVQQPSVLAWPEVATGAEPGGTGGATIRELIPAEILARREQELSRPVIRVVTPSADTVLTGLHLALLAELRAIARRRSEEGDPAALDTGAAADRLLVRRRRVIAALSNLLESGLAEPAGQGRHAADGACRISALGERAREAARRAARAQRTESAPDGAQAAVGPGEGADLAGVGPGEDTRPLRVVRIRGPRVLADRAATTA